MNKIFRNIDLDKRDRIINSALEEFSKNSFEKASTNNIVKNAGISKGLLYHYFKNKKALYEYLETFAIVTTIDAILDEIDWEEKDLFERIRQVLVIKFRVLIKYPEINTFSKVVYEKKSIDEIKKMVETHAPSLYSDMYRKNIDFTLFKDNVDINKAIKITEWTLQMLSEELIRDKRVFDGDVDYEELKHEFDIYLNMLKEAFYK